MFVPLATESTPATTLTESAPTPSVRPSGACVLVVDDDPLSRALQARLAGLLGYRARVASDAAQALDIALDGSVDAMLLDLGMPEVDGFTLLERLRASERQRGLAALPVIAVTGYAAALDRLRCLMAGFNDHLAKPIEVGALDAALARNLPLSARPLAPANDAARVEAAARRLAQARPGDARFGPTLLETFAMRSGQLIEQITQAHAAGDAVALAQSLKALTTSAEFMGAVGLATLCDSLRTAVAADESAGTSARTAMLVQSLADEHQSVLTVLLRAARDGAGTTR
ncbi:MAG: response regulator [Burkholderiaceae bacterium]|nr:response regulator [Burkholderiaceae bacterium]